MIANACCACRDTAWPLCRGRSWARSSTTSASSPNGHPARAALRDGAGRVGRVFPDGGAEGARASLARAASSTSLPPPSPTDPPTPDFDIAHMTARLHQLQRRAPSRAFATMTVPRPPGRPPTSSPAVPHPSSPTPRSGAHTLAGAPQGHLPGGHVAYATRPLQHRTRGPVLEITRDAKPQQRPCRDRTGITSRSTDDYPREQHHHQRTDSGAQ
jgi:hypothetical protein